MPEITIENSNYCLLDCIDGENLLKEHKEFFLKKSMSIDDIHDILNHVYTHKIERLTYESVVFNIDKYLSRYILSLSNIQKIFLPTCADKTHSKFYLGVSDSGEITGIPMKRDKIDTLKQDLKRMINNHLQDMVGVHQKKGGEEEVTINNKKYYHFEKLMDILKKHTKIKIHIIQKNTICNKQCTELQQKINDILQEEIDYFSKLASHKKLKEDKKKYNDKYSIGFQKLIRSDDVMNQFRDFITLSNEDFDKLLALLKEKIKKHNDVENVLLNGKYILGSLSEINTPLDNKYNKHVNIFLDEYKGFKKLMLSKNIHLDNFKQKNPRKRINPLLTNISCFNQYLDVEYCIIEILIPVIKDNQACIILKKDKKIKLLERGYINNNPCTYETVL